MKNDLHIHDGARRDLRIAEITNEQIDRVRDRIEVGLISGGQVVDDAHRISERDELRDEMRAYESSAPRNETCESPLLHAASMSSRACGTQVGCHAEGSAASSQQEASLGLPSFDM